MEVRLESTDKIVTLNGVPARLWEGHTAAGVPCHAYVTRIAVWIAVSNTEDSSEFDRELQEHRPPSEEAGIGPACRKRCGAGGVSMLEQRKVVEDGQAVA